MACAHTLKFLLASERWGGQGGWGGYPVVWHTDDFYSQAEVGRRGITFCEATHFGRADCCCVERHFLAAAAAAVNWNVCLTRTVSIY